MKNLHSQHVPHKTQIQRASDLGVVISTQPTFPYLRGGSGSVYESRLGSRRLVVLTRLSFFGLPPVVLVVASPAQLQPT